MELPKEPEAMIAMLQAEEDIAKESRKAKRRGKVFYPLLDLLEYEENLKESQIIVP